MRQNFGWIEIVVFAGIALGFGLWQLVSINREIARDKAAKAAREAKDASEVGAHASAAGAGHPVGDQQLDDR